MIKRIMSVLFALFMLDMILLSCHGIHKPIAVSQKGVEIFSDDTALHVRNGIFYFGRFPFTGNVKELYPDRNTRSIQRFQEGKQNGLSETFFENGKKESARWYKNGEKDSVHIGWWWNGNKKYEYHFNNGSYNGIFTEWYQSGKMLQQIMYIQGNESYGRGWRENGKLYMNFVLKDNRRYGLNNSNLCYTVKKGKLN